MLSLSFFLIEVHQKANRQFSQNVEQILQATASQKKSIWQQQSVMYVYPTWNVNVIRYKKLLFEYLNENFIEWKKAF